MNYKNAKHGKIVESSSAPAQHQTSQASLAQWQRPRDASQDSPKPQRRAGDRRKGMLAATPVPAVVPPI